MLKFFRFSFLIVALLSLTVSAQIPVDYYNTALGKSNATLKTALHQIIEVGTRLTYGSGSNSTWSGFEKTDLDPDGYVWDMYSNNKVKFPGNGATPSGLNIEHSVAKSWWGGTNNYAYKDLYHLNPSNAQANSARGSYPLGVNNGGTFDNGCIKVGNNTFGSEYNGKCFEPLDEYKGDFARAYLYMFTCYEDFNWIGTNAPTMLVANETWPMLKTWAKNLLLQWSRQDPVSEKELKRSAEIYKIQGNRNPFIDYPELAEYLWGNLQGQAWYPVANNEPYLTTPAKGAKLNFGAIAYEHTDTASIWIKGNNINENLTLTITGLAAYKFSLPTFSISPAQAKEGYKLLITYNALNVETSNAVLTISGGGMKSPVQIDLVATATDGFLVLDTSNVTDKSFTANWTASAGATGYLLNVYQLTGTAGPTQTLLENNFDSGFPSGWTSTGYYDTSTSSNLKMGSGSQNCLITTNTLDLSKPTVVTVKSKQYSSDAGAKLWLIAGTNDTITSFINSADYQTFTYDIPAKQSSTKLSFYAVINKRVYLDYVKLTTLGTTQTAVNVLDYPKSVGNVLTYNVESLESNTNYYYTVTPEGNSTGVSDVISVRTDLTNGNENVLDKKIIWYKNQSGIVVKNIPSNCHVSIFTTTGQILGTYSSGHEEMRFNPESKGIYFLKAQSGDYTHTIKIVF